MYKRIMMDGYMNLDFVNGVENFIQIVCSSANDLIKCLCQRRRNRRYRDQNEVKMHLC